MTRRWWTLLSFSAFGAAFFALSACGDGSNPEPTATNGPAQGTATRPANDVASRISQTSYPLNTAKGTRLGNPDAKVVLEIFEDFQCPFCLRYSLTLEPVFVDEYVLTGKVRFEFKNFPILGPESVKAAMAASCAAEQNVFWPFHHRLFLEQAKAGQLEAERLNAGRFSDDKLAAYAVESGAKKEAFDACFADAATVTKLQEAAREAQALGLRSTPTWVVGTQVLAGGPRDAAAMRKLLDEALAK